MAIVNEKFSEKNKLTDWIWGI